MSNQDQQPEVIQLDPRETFVIQMHANIRYTAASRLTPEQNKGIQDCRQKLHDFIKENGDEGRVALQLFFMEYDNASTTPFGDKFANMEQVPWDEAIKMWREGHAEVSN